MFKNKLSLVFLVLLPFAANASTVSWTSSTAITENFSAVLSGTSGEAIQATITGSMTYNPQIVDMSGYSEVDSVTAFSLTMYQTTWTATGSLLYTAGIGDLQSIKITANNPDGLTMSVFFESDGTVCSFCDLEVGSNPNSMLFPVPPDEVGLPIGFIRGTDTYGGFDPALSNYVASAPEASSMLLFGVGLSLIGAYKIKRKRA